MQHLSKRKNRQRSIGDIKRPFKLDIRDRFVMILIYYRLISLVHYQDFSLTLIRRVHL
jgi:hypothetical protein